jgi:hypothetical protein
LSSNFSLTFKNKHQPQGKLHCAEATLTGTLTKNGQPTDNASFTGSSFGGCTSELGFEVRAVFGAASLEHGGVAFPEGALELQRPGAKAVCAFSGKKDKGKFPVTGGAMAVTFAHEKLEDNVVGPLCPRRANMSGTFSISSGGFPVKAVTG